MKKQTSKKRLNLNTEKVRTLQNIQVLSNDVLRGIVGGAPTGHTTSEGTGYDPSTTC